MGDWTSGAARVHACPPHRVRSVLSAFAEYGFAYEDNSPDYTTLILGEWYCGTEIRCGSAAELAAELIANAPEAAFTLHEEPAYEWTGTYCAYTQKLGLFTAECDTSGEPMFTQSDVLRWAGEPAKIRDRKLGVLWKDAVADLPGGTVVEPDRLAAYWSPRHNDIAIVDGLAEGGDLVLPAANTEAEIDTVLAGHGFRRASEWSPVDEDAPFWRVDVYRFPAPDPGAP